MKKKIFLVVFTVLAIACSHNNELYNPNSEYSSDSIPSTNSLIGVWEINNYVYYVNENDIELICSIQPSNNGRFLSFEKIEDSSGDLLLKLEFSNVLYTSCNLTQRNSIKINNEWGGTELFDTTGNEERLIALLNSVDIWFVYNNFLYLIDSKSSLNYNALCLKKK